MQVLIARLAGFANLALVFQRVILGIILAYHGWQKVSGGGYGVGFFRDVGIPLPQVMGPFVSFLELGGGLALIAGLFTRYLGVLFVLEFLVAVWVKWIALGRGYGGSEFELIILSVAALLATNGGGDISVDRMLRRSEV